MKYKRKKSKRSVKCTLCTKFRWLGNSKQRLSKQEMQNSDRQKEEYASL